MDGGPSLRDWWPHAIILLGRLLKILFWASIIQVRPVAFAATKIKLSKHDDLKRLKRGWQLNRRKLRALQRKVEGITEKGEFTRSVCKNL